MAGSRLELPRAGASLRVTDPKENTTSARLARHRRRVLFTAVLIGAVAGIALAGALWVGFKASAISRELNAANQLVPVLRDAILNDDDGAAMATVTDLQRHTSGAREATEDPLWRMAKALPWMGANLQAISEVATSANDIAELGVAPLVSISKTLGWESLSPTEKGLDLKPLSSAQPKLASAAQAVRQSSDRLNGIRTDALMPQIAAPLIRAREQLDALSEGLDSASDAASVLPEMLGEKSPRRYLLLIQNNAESRATGGIPGALAVLTVDKGKLSLGSQTSASAMGAFDPALRVDPEQRQIYSARLGKFMQDVNLTPDFPSAAATAHAMWKTETGEQLDGVLSIDPVALSYILDATGPVHLSEQLLQTMAVEGLPHDLTAQNVVTTLLSDVYSKIREPQIQDEYFAAVAQAVFSEISNGSADTKKVITALARGASERRVLVWSSNEDEEATISRYPVGGSITGPAISPAQFGIYFNDGTGAKMDYHVKRTVQLIKTCPANGYSEVRIRVRSTNSAPQDAATSLPEYVTGGGVFGVPAGTVQTNIVAYGPVQAHVETAVADGNRIAFAAQVHRGRPVGTVTVALPPGKSSTVEFTFGKIVQHSEPELAVTPTVQAREDVVLDTIEENCAPASQRSVNSR